METLYLIDYVENGKTMLVAILDDVVLVNCFMKNTNWIIDKKSGDWVLPFTATKYQKEPSGVVMKQNILDYSHLKPSTPPPLKKLRIQHD